MTAIRIGGPIGKAHSTTRITDRPIERSLLTAIGIGGPIGKAYYI